MNCEVCDVNPIEWTLIPAGPEGMPQTLCSACLARFGLEAAKKVLPPEEIAQQLGPMFVAPAQAAPSTEAGAGRRGRKSQPPAEVQDQAQEPAEAADAGGAG